MEKCNWLKQKYALIHQKSQDLNKRLQYSIIVIVRDHVRVKNRIEIRNPRRKHVRGSTLRVGRRKEGARDDILILSGHLNLIREFNFNIEILDLIEHDRISKK